MSESASDSMRVRVFTVRCAGTLFLGLPMHPPLTVRELTQAYVAVVHINTHVRTWRECVLVRTCVRVRCRVPTR